MESNNTRSYLFPCLKKYGNEFVDLIVKELHKVKVCIGDVIYTKTTGGTEFPCLFFLIDTSVQTGRFLNALERLKKEGYFVADYVYDDIKNGNLHMIILKFPSENIDAFYKFINGEYSKMYSGEDIELLFNGKLRSKEAMEQRQYVINVLKKDPEIKPSFVRFLNLQFGSNITEEQFDGELELPIRTNEEYFNYEYNDLYF